MPKYVNLFSQYSINETLEPPKSIVKVESADIIAADLLPMQTQLDPNKSIKHSLTKPNITRNLFQRDPVMIKKPIIVFNSKYIMDGHHSWAECVINRPNDEISCINLIGDVDPITMLAHVKKRLRVSSDIILSKGMSSNLDLYTMDEDIIIQYVADHLTDVCEEIYMEYGIPDVATHIVNGILRLQEFNQPISGAIKRSEMPQFGSRDARRVALNNIHNSEISELKHILLFESLIDTPPISDYRAWYNLSQSHLAEFSLSKLGVEVYGNVPTADVYAEAGYPNLDKTLEKYGIYLTYRADANYNGGLKTDQSKYVGPTQNIKWLEEILDKIQQHFIGDIRKIQIEYFDFNAPISKWAKDDWLVKFKLTDSSYHDMPTVDDRITLDPAFIDRIVTTRKLIEAGLLPPTQSLIDDKDNPHWIFAQYSDDRWVLVEVDDEGRPITRNDSIGKYIQYSYQYKPNDYEKKEQVKRALLFKDKNGNMVTENYTSTDIRALHDLGLANEYSVLGSMSRDELLAYADPIQPMIDSLQAQLIRLQNHPKRYDALHRLSIMHQTTDTENELATMQEIVKAAQSEVFILKIKHDGGDINHLWSITNCHILSLPDINPAKWNESDTIYQYDNVDGETVETIVVDPNDVGGLIIFFTNGAAKSTQHWGEIYYSPDSKYPIVN